MAGLLRYGFVAGALSLVTAGLSGQVIEFESGGFKYQTLSRQGVTIMFAELPVQIRNYAVLQVTVQNGSASTRTLKPEDFRFEREDGTVIRSMPAIKVVEDFMERGGRTDVVRLVAAYESGLYGLNKFESTNGYEIRRQNAAADLVNSRFKAAATASAIVLVAAQLKPGQSTDGAVFFPNNGKPLDRGKLIVEAWMERWEFPIGGEPPPREFKIR